MLPKKNRLPSPDIQLVGRSGKRLSGQFFQIACIKTTGDGCRFAVIVPKKVDKRAVVRNRIKRLIHESVHHLLPYFSQTYDGVIYVQSKPPGDEQDAVEAQIKRALTEGSVLSLPNTEY